MRFLLFFLSFVLSVYGVNNGEVKLINLDKNSTVIFEGKKIPVIENPIKKGSYFVLVPIKYRAKRGESTLVIDGKKVPLHVELKKYKKEYIKVAKSKVHPSKKALKRIRKEYMEAMKIYSTITPERYWSKPFVLPLNSKLTSSYGNARMFNHTLKSFHSGADFRAKMKTPIRATNDGVVVIANKRYYAGGSVVIDHGEGLYSCYFHLSKILVKVGQKVKQKELLGLSGMSGRVSGPHLHYGIRLYANAINPIQFTKEIDTIFKVKR
jgi:murein DD-endopeptidase MepM/ murein hydrolase activator NlpD